MERLQVFLELITGQYKREANEAAAATDKIGTSAKTAGTTTTNSLKGANTQVAAFKGLIAGAAVGAVVAFGKSTIDAASSLEESMNAVNVTFGDAADGIHSLGEDAVDSFGLSERAFNQFAVRFSAFAEQIAARDGRSVVDIVEEMTTRIADFASVHDLTMEEAATIAQSTLAGETEAFRRFGGDVSAAAVQLKAMELGLGDTSAELTEQEKILARYELFMEQTEKTAGDFANTQDSLANQQRTLTANFEEFQAMLGNAVIPALAESLGLVNDMLGAFNLLADVLPGASEGGFELGDAFGWAVRHLGPLGTALDVAQGWLSIFEQNAEKAKDRTDALNDSVGDGEDAIAAYNEAAQPVPPLLDEMTFALGRGEDALATYNDMAREGGAAWDTNTASIEENITALQEQQDQIRSQTDPLFALFSATQDQTEAQQTLNDLIAAGTTSGPEYEQALVDVGIAALDVKDAQAQARVATDLTKQAFIDQQVAAGNTRQAAEDLADVLFGLSGLKLDPIQLAVEIRDLRRAAGSQAGGYQEYHSGGVVTGPGPIGSEVLAKVLVGEIITPIGGAPPTATTSSAGGVNIENLYAMGTPASIAHDVGQQVSLELRMA